MCKESQLHDIVRAMVECYRSVYGRDIVDIVLYGSYARGDYMEDSNIDIVAVVRGDRRELQEKLKIIWDRFAEIGLENDVIVSPTVIPYDEFVKYQYTLPYYRNIMEGDKRSDDLIKYCLIAADEKLTSAKVLLNVDIDKKINRIYYRIIKGVADRLLVLSKWCTKSNRYLGQGRLLFCVLDIR